MKTLLHYSKPIAVNALLALLLIGVFSISAASAQISAYTVTQFSDEYVSIANDDVSSSFLQDEDDATEDLQLPFDFTYDGTVFSAGTLMAFCSNGFLAIGSDPGPFPDPNLINVADRVNNCMLPFSTDLVLNDFNSSGGSFAGYFEVTGTAPNRVATYEWSDFILYNYDGYTSGGMQIKIYETTNVVEFWYANPGYGFSGATLPGPFGDPAPAWVGLNGSPYSSDNNFVTTDASSLPSTDLRFTPPIPLFIELSVQPKSLSFGSFQAGTTSNPQCVSVQDVGSYGTLVINGASITGSSDFTIVSSPETNTYGPGDPAGQYCVVFRPTSPGIINATLSIASNGMDSGLQTVALTGVGTVSDYTIDSLVRFKKTRTRLGDTLTQYLHITSTGQSPLFFSGINISGLDAGQYTVSYFPTNPLPPGQSDSIGITYIPTLEGRHPATLTLLSNAFLNPSVTVSLQGTGILPHIVVTPTVLLFDSTREGDTVCKNVDIWNPGSDTLIIFSNTLTSNDGDFHYSGLSGENTHIPPDNHKLVSVCFIPLQRGTRQARLVLKTNIIKTFDTPRRDTAGSITIDIHGNGTPFGFFGNAVSGSPVTDSAIIGVTVCRTDTLMNKGDGDIMVSGLTIAGSQFTYSGLPAFPFLLKTHSFITFTICGTPDQQGLISGTATVSGTTSGVSIGAILPLNIYGFKPCISPSPLSLFDGLILPNNGSDSTICDTITNCGDIDAIYHATLNGGSKADYSVTPAVSGNIAAHGGTAIFCVKYKPTAIGTSPASLDIITEDGSESAKIPLNGADGCAQLIHGVPIIPNTGENERDTFTFTINNSGGTPWSPGNPSISGTGAGAYTVLSVVPDPIPAGGQGVVTVEFHPQLGTANQTITASLSWPLGGPCQSDTVSVDLNGQSIQSSVGMTAESEGFTLDQSYPNPTQGNATFTYSTPREAEVRIALVDLTGKVIRTLITGRVSEGPHTVNFDARDLSSGTYVYMLESGSTKLVRQFILTK